MRGRALPGRSGGPRPWPGNTHLNHLSGERIEDQHGCVSPVGVPVERRHIAVGSRRSEQLRRVGEPFVYSSAAAARDGWHLSTRRISRAGRRDKRTIRL